MATGRLRKSSQPLMVHLNRMLTGQTKATRASRVMASVSKVKNTVSVSIIRGAFHFREDTLKPKTSPFTFQAMTA